MERFNSSKYYMVFDYLLYPVVSSVERADLCLDLGVDRFSLIFCLPVLSIYIDIYVAPCFRVAARWPVDDISTNQISSIHQHRPTRRRVSVHYRQRQAYQLVSPWLDVSEP